MTTQNSYHMIHKDTGEYIRNSNGHRTIVSEKTKDAYHRMYGSFKNGPLENVRFELVKEDAHVNYQS